VLGNLFCITSFHVTMSSLPWSGALHLIFHRPTFLHPFSVFFSQHMPIHRNLFWCSINIISSIPSLSLDCLLGTLSFTLTLHIRLTTKSQSIVNNCSEPHYVCAYLCALLYHTVQRKTVLASSLLSSIQSPLLRYCLLAGKRYEKMDNNFLTK